MADASGTVPFKWWVVDDWVRVPEVVELPELEVAYDNDVERGKSTSLDYGSWPAFLRNTFCKMGSFQTAADWSIRLGYTVNIDPVSHGGGLHVMDPGGWLQVHLDYAKHPKIPNHTRKLNLILFLTHGWKPEHGGQLLLCNPDGSTSREIEPVAGRLVGFEVSDLSYHGVRQVSPFAARKRVTLASYFLTQSIPNETRERAMFFPNRSKDGGAPMEVRL